MKPCPFCGTSSVRVRHFVNVDVKDNCSIQESRTAMVCTTCGAEGPTCLQTVDSTSNYQEDEARALWGDKRA